ncbi:DUF4214 domain-containing protein [Pseudomonas fluorescens]|uniref:DUF4214 domain-containing protein n=1 Tax=Pseudomonas fluorescens TaxID=294 RepID=UPI001241BFA5|nr:DUF4214 domain-containing protein [Pseudomonas fluorescens]
MATQAQLKAVQELYVAYLGRAADSAGQAFWADAIVKGTATIKTVATGFTLSAEYKAAYAGLTPAALVDKIYTNLLGRPSDAAGKAFWVDALAKGTVTADTLAATMVTNLGALDQATINNKVFVAQTYTDAAGAAYNPAAGTAVLVGVDSTPASVTAALATISNGTLAGLVPAQGLIAALDAAQNAVVANNTAKTAAVDALVAKLAANVAVSDTDAINALSSYAAKISAITNDAAAFRLAASGEPSTTVLVTRASDASTALEAARALLSADAKTKGAAYEAAAKTNASLTAAKVADVAGVKAGLTADTAFSVGVIAKAALVDVSITNSGSLYDFYVAGSTTAAQRVALDAALKDVPYLATFKATASIDVAKNAAVVAVNTTKAAVDLVDTAVVKFSALADTKVLADATLVKAQAADVDVAAVKAINDQAKVLDDAVAKALVAVDAFASTGVTLHKIAAGVAPDASATVAKDVFFFADKANLAAGTDYSIGTTAANAFGAGDSIVLGSAYTFNNGALTTGNGNALEFFLVKGATGTQVVIETAKHGSATTTVDAAGTVVLSGDAAVITLTGVTADHVSVANGVISYV